MRLRDLASEIDGVDVRFGNDPARGDKRVTGLTADSRDVEPGFVFAAIAGTQHDGARFIPHAIEAGADALLVTPDVAATLGKKTPLFISKDPRAALAHLAAKFYPAQPDVICAVTGTNGKTSVASFLRQIWRACGKKSASIGTLGIVTDEGTTPLGHTTPDPVEVHRTLSSLAQSGVTHLVLEASSHGLAQHRLDGVHIAAGAFTNLSRDHLDYHESFEDYLAAKMRLFSVVITDGGAAVLNADSECFAAVHDAATARGLSVMSVGASGADIHIDRVEPTPNGLNLTLAYDGKKHDLSLPLVGAFQASNALVAAGLAIATGTPPEEAFEALENLEGAEGRMDRVATLPNGAAVFVDYAHTPDALATALGALRPHAEGRLHVVIGAGGDRDRGKRPQMGRIASELADVVIVTDDNPRNEDPAAIRAEILAAAPGAQEIADRRAAIDVALGGLEPGDVLLVAGKGHESGQTAKGVTQAFKDADVICELMKEGARS
jgi:UDP-N-acetylmuramoyl-L-alanyl-D-glutamate--2,6-diaminopimelate ligase